jgi:FMN phosphatase YigB (HAD superfamily)
MKLRLYLLAVAATITINHVEAFSLRMTTDIPPPLRSVASAPPSSTSSSLRFKPPPKAVLSTRLAAATTIEASPYAPPSTADDDAPRKTKTLGLLTFDLDDSLYPIAPVLHDANEIFVRIMSDYGYDLDQDDIVEAGKRIRAEAGPVAGAAMSHTEVRLEAIRREMERLMLEQKLRECAADWATEVHSLTSPVRQSAERWARAAVSQTVVESIYSAWERERHHSAERHLYPEILSSLQRIREDHPDVVIGAVTDGKANPMLMVFSLAPYFDFCMSWEDDAAGRTEFFKELGNVDGNADLQWIYRAARERYEEIAETKREMKMSLEDGELFPKEEGEGDNDDPLWIHVGDDLAYDVGGSASCGARTVLLDLDEEYGQTAKVRFSGTSTMMPSWNTASEEELANRNAMNEAAECMVDKRVSRLSMLPDAIDEILKGE